ncbi:TPA: hypothetical protein P7Z59_004337 [Escherichia coli]|nr:hypothetical protein [Escherichia coli]HDQ2792916.1 hypothetical protein [Escherichia coli]
MSFLKNTAFGIRCHRIENQELVMHSQLCNFFKVPPSNIFFVLDDTKIKQPSNNTQEIQIISINDYINSKNIKTYPQNIGWLCGDLFYYALAQKQQFDFYWLIEPDVSFGDGTYNFFNTLEANHDDFIAPRFGEISSTSYWYHTGKDISDRIYSCSFPLTRMSFNAIRLCEKYRIEMFDMDASKKIPNDEVFISTTLKKHGFSTSDLCNITKLNFSNFSTTIPLLSIDNKKADHIYHPALIWDEFISKYTSRFISALSNGNHVNFVQKSIQGLNSSQLKEVAWLIYGNIK